MIKKVIIEMDDGTFFERPVTPNGNNTAYIEDKFGTRLIFTNNGTFTELSQENSLGRAIVNLCEGDSETGQTKELSVSLLPNKCVVNDQPITDIIDVAILRDQELNPNRSCDLMLQVFADVHLEDATDEFVYRKSDIVDALA